MQRHLPRLVGSVLVPLLARTAAAQPSDPRARPSEESLPPQAAAMVAADFSEPMPAYRYEPHHNHRFTWHNLAAIRVNPLGLTNRFRTGYQMQLSHRPEPIFEQSYASVQLDSEITPAFGAVAARFELQPAALFNFWASYGFVGTFGSSSYSRSFPSHTADYSDATLKATRELDYATTGHRATVSALFQFGLGGLAFRNQVMGHFASMKLREGDQVFWDASLDLLQPNSGWVLTNDADLLILTEFKLKFGLRHTFTAAFYDDDAANNANTPHQRLGLAALYTFFDDKIGTTWNKPTLALIAQWWLEHRFRTAENPALPYLALAFLQEGDFFVSPKK